MSKPYSGISWLFNCPVCGNRKSTFYRKDNIFYCKCTKCETKYKIEKSKEE